MTKMKIKNLLASLNTKITLGRRTYLVVEQFTQLFAFGSNLSEFIQDYCQISFVLNLQRKSNLFTATY